MRIAIGSDHAGFPLKEVLRAFLLEKQYEVFDKGCYSLDSVDYPKFAEKVGRAVGSEEVDLGVLICGTGIGISIAANKIHGVRAALCHNSYASEMARLHNDANVLCMGARVLGEGVALHVLEQFILTEFEGGRHQRRVDQMTALEKV